MAQETWSEAAHRADEGLVIVDNVLSFAKTTQGNPGKREQALFLASTAMSYAVWENYAEQVAIEAVTFVADQITPDKVPDTPKGVLSKSSAWDLSVHPGWKAMWVEAVRTKAIGTPDQDFGLNTAGPEQVRRLFDLVGLVAFDGLDASVPDKLAALVNDRGTIVHTAQPPSGSFRKRDAVGWRDFVKELYEGFDLSIQRQVTSLVGASPW